MTREIIETPEGPMLRCPRCPPEDNLWFLSQFYKRYDDGKNRKIPYSAFCRACTNEGDLRQRKKRASEKAQASA